MTNNFLPCAIPSNKVSISVCGLPRWLSSSLQLLSLKVLSNSSKTITTSWLISVKKSAIPRKYELHKIANDPNAPIAELHRNIHRGNEILKGNTVSITDSERKNYWINRQK